MYSDLEYPLDLEELRARLGGYPSIPLTSCSGLTAAGKNGLETRENQLGVWQPNPQLLVALRRVRSGRRVLLFLQGRALGRLIERGLKGLWSHRWRKLGPSEMS